MSDFNLYLKNKNIIDDNLVFFASKYIDYSVVTIKSSTDKEDDLLKSDSWYTKYGFIAAAVGRNIPIVRTLISLPIGIARLSFIKFIIYTTIGSIPWTFAFVYFGFSLGNNWVEIKDIIDRLKYPIIIFFLILLISRVIRAIKKR